MLRVCAGTDLEAGTERRAGLWGIGLSLCAMVLIKQIGILFAWLAIALMLVLGFVESLMPVAAGVPGIKLGLSNGVLIFAVYMLNLPTAFVLMVLKVVLSGLLFGGVNAMMYAFAGGWCAWCYDVCSAA